MLNNKHQADKLQLGEVNLRRIGTVSDRVQQIHKVLTLETNSESLTLSCIVNFIFMLLTFRTVIAKTLYCVSIRTLPKLECTQTTTCYLVICNNCTMHGCHFYFLKFRICGLTFSRFRSTD